MARYLSVSVAFGCVLAFSCDRQRSADPPGSMTSAPDPAAEQAAVERLTTTMDGKRIEGKLLKLDCSGGDPTITTNNWPIHVITRPDGKGGQRVDEISCDEGADFIYEQPVLFVFCPVSGSPPPSAGRPRGHQAR
jgi:hypothetical protein